MFSLDTGFTPGHNLLSYNGLVLVKENITVQNVSYSLHLFFISQTPLRISYSFPCVALVT